MSMLLMVQAMKIKVGNPLRKLVLIKLADNANDMGECWPSYQHIADQCEIDRSTVRKHIKALEEAGFLRIENRDGPKGNSSNLYFLSLPPVGQEHPPVGPEPTPPVGPESTRTSHSFKPVNEPLLSGHQVSLETAFEVFWSAGMRKLNKKGALKSFQAACKRIKADPQEFAQKLAADVAERIKAGQLGFDAMHPTTYLNNERWEDEIVKAASKTSIGQDSDRWWNSDAGIQRKAAQEGVQVRPGESYRDLADRIRSLEQQGQLKSQQPQQTIPVENTIKNIDIPF